MHKNNYLYNSGEEIIKLKEDLMSSNNNSVVSFSSEYFKNRNSEIGKIFEENIKSTMEFEFGWEKGNDEEHFFYRTVKIDENEYVLKREGKLALKINGQNYSLISNSDNITLKRGKKILKQYANNKRAIIKGILSRKKLLVNEEKEMEIDGYYLIENFDFSLLNEDFSILFRNIDDEKLEEVSSVLIEAKLNKSKIPEMITQIKEDKKIYDKMTDNNILYMGIVGSSGRKKNININFAAELDGIKCVILEMNNSNFFGRNMKNPLDWKLIRQVKDLQSSVDEMKGDIKEIKALLGSYSKNGKIKLLGNKRRRPKKE